VTISIYVVLAHPGLANDNYVEALA